MSAPKFTPKPWQAIRLVDADTNENMSAEQLGEYVKNAVMKSFEESGSMDFLAIIGPHEDGNVADVCHVGNGPRSPWNAQLIAAVPEMYEALRAMLIVAEHGECESMHPDAAEEMARAALAKADGGAS